MMPGGRVAVLVVKRTALSTATRSTTRPGRQVRAEAHPAAGRSNVLASAATNGLEKSGARWRIRHSYDPKVFLRFTTVNNLIGPLYESSGSKGQPTAPRRASAAAAAGVQALPARVPFSGTLAEGGGEIRRDAWPRPRIKMITKKRERTLATGAVPKRHQ